jgi:hypothetical protein
MLEVFPHFAEALDILDKFLCLKLQLIAEQGLGAAAAANPRRLRDQAYSRQNMLESARRILQECRGTASASSAAAAVTREPRKSSAKLPGKHPRAAGPEDVMLGRCPCVQGQKFPQWLHWDCCLGHIVVTPATVFTDCRTIIPTVLHSLKFQILSRCRTHPVDLASIMRGVIDESDLRTLRVPGTAEAYMGASASPVQPEPWDSTDKHKVMWLVPATLVLAAIKGKGR